MKIVQEIRLELKALSGMGSSQLANGLEKKSYSSYISFLDLPLFQFVIAYSV